MSHICFGVFASFQLRALPDQFWHSHLSAVIPTRVATLINMPGAVVALLEHIILYSHLQCVHAARHCKRVLTCLSTTKSCTRDLRHLASKAYACVCAGYVCAHAILSIAPCRTDYGQHQSKTRQFSSESVVIVE